MPQRRHVFALVVFVSLLLLTLYFVATHSKAYEEATQFISSDTRVGQSIGRVNRVEFKFWKGFEFTDRRANFSFEAKSEVGIFDVDIYLSCAVEKWRVEWVDIRSQSGQEKRIVNVDAR